MNALVRQKTNDITALCARFRVKRLELFGSAASGDFDAGKSDIDFLVEFLPLKQNEYADAYFGLLEELQKLLNAPIDLVMTRAIRNPYFLQGIEKSRVVLYAA